MRSRPPAAKPSERVFGPSSQAEKLAGEARVAGERLVALTRALRAEGPLTILAGGETTVTVRGPGRGGRNQELALAAALALEDAPGIALLAAGSDGSDGPTDAAGAFADGSTVARGRALGLDAEQALLENDSYAFFAAEGGTFRTGPTRTNVMDLVFLVREGSAFEAPVGELGREALLPWSSNER